MEFPLKITVIFSLITVIPIKLTDSLDNGLVLTPPMGWLSWERFGCNVKCKSDPKHCLSERLFMEIADRIVEDGYKDVGYDRVNIDDCWMQKKRAKDGKLYADDERFPNGIKHLSDYIHSKGLKIGIYQNYGYRTCMNFPGLIGHSKIDAQTYADWDIDMVKLDACFTPIHALDKGYIEFGQYLNATGRRMVYSCSWPYYQLHTSGDFAIPDWGAIAKHCNIWRTYHDIHTNWKDIIETIDFAGDHQEIFTRFVGPGQWNDPDMLLIGNNGMTPDQAKVQMGIWAIIAAPLFMSNDLRNIKPVFRDILINKDVININQDKMGIPGKRIFHNDSIDIWLRPILPRDSANQYTSFAIAFVNRKYTTVPINFKVKLSELGLNSTYAFKDVFENKDLGVMNSQENLHVSVPETGIRLMTAQIKI